MSADRPLELHAGVAGAMATYALAQAQAVAAHKAEASRKSWLIVAKLHMGAAGDSRAMSCRSLLQSFHHRRSYSLSTS